MPRAQAHVFTIIELQRENRNGNNYPCVRFFSIFIFYLLGKKFKYLYHIYWFFYINMDINKKKNSNK